MKNSVSIIIPAYREEQSIKKVISNILEIFKKQNLDFEIIPIIDKAHNDRTYEIALALASQFNEIKLLSREEKGGVATAIMEGIKHSSKDVVIIAMADESENPDDLLKLALKMNEGYDMVFGNRFIQGVKLKDYSAKKYFVNRLCNFLIRILFGIKSNDITNAVKAYKSTILHNIKIKSVGFEIFAELPIRSYINNHKNFTEIPISHYVRNKKNSKFSIIKEGPKYFKIIIDCLFNK